MGFRYGGTTAGDVTFGSPAGQIDVGDANNEGASGAAARADHQHALPQPTEAPPALAAASAAGALTRTARQDHTHAHTPAHHDAGGHADLTGVFAAVGAPAAAAAVAVGDHEAAGDPHGQYVLESATFNVERFGAIGDGATDASAAFQAAIDAAFAAGGGQVHVPTGRFLLASGITVRSNVELVGTNRVVHEVTSPDLIDQVLIADLEASVLLPTSTTQPAITLRGSSPAVVGLTIFYPNQVLPTAAAPTVYPATITLHAAEVVHAPTVIDCFIPNAYQAVVFTSPHNKSRIERCHIGAYNRGIVIGRNPDKCYINDVFFSIWYAWVHGFRAGEAIDAYVKANLIAVELLRVDWADINRLFVFQALYGLLLDAGPGAGGMTDGGPSGVAVNVGIDNVKYGIYAAATSGTGFDVVAPTIYASDAGVARCIFCDSTVFNTVTHKAQLRVFGGSLSGSVDLDNNAAIVAGSLTFTGTEFYGQPAGAGILYTSAPDFLRLTGCRWHHTGVGLNIGDALPGKVVLAGNDLGAATYAPPATVPSGGYKAGGNFGIPSIGW